MHVSCGGKSLLQILLGTFGTSTKLALAPAALWTAEMPALQSEWIRIMGAAFRKACVAAVSSEKEAEGSGCVKSMRIPLKVLWSIGPTIAAHDTEVIVL